MRPNTQTHNEQPRILICDDDPGTLLMLRTLFEKHGFTICGEASTGVETITQTVAQQPDVVLLDIGMPMGTGLSVLPVLREIDENLCVIMLTVDNRSESVHTAISLGAKGYIVKSYLDPDHLLSAVQRAAGLPPLLDKPTEDVALGEIPDTIEKAEIYAARSVEEPQPLETAETAESSEIAVQEPPPDIPDEMIKVVVDDLPGIGKIYITGKLHNSETGSLFLYHPLTASHEQGEVKHTFREILRHPSFFMSLFKRLEGFKEVPSVLYDQSPDGGVFELLLKPMPSKGRLDVITFALRYYQSAERSELPVGLEVDGGPLLHAYESLPNEYLLNEDMANPDLPNYFCTFSGLSLEACLFLSAFNMHQILELTSTTQVTEERLFTHIHEVQEYAKWQEIPKAVLFGPMTLVPVPGDPEAALAVTNSLSSVESSSEDRTDLYYWIDSYQYTTHLQHYLNRWSLGILPLLMVPDCGSVSLFFTRGQKPRLCFKDSTNAAALFEERGYTSISLKDLIRKWPTLRLPDLLRPLLLNTLIARFPSMQLTQTLGSSSDIRRRRQHAKELTMGDGLQWIENSKPFLYKESCEELKQQEINESNPEYTKELVRQITQRYNATVSLPAKRKPLEPIAEEEMARRIRVKDKTVREQRYKDKYGEP